MRSTILTILMLTIVFESLGQIVFEKLSIKSAFKKAKREQKKVLMYLTNPRCDSSQYLIKSVEGLNGVDSALNSEFLVINYDEESFLKRFGKKVKLKETDSSSAYPFIVVFDQYEHLLYQDRVKTNKAFLGVLYMAQEPVLANELFSSYQKMSNDSSYSRDSLVVWVERYLKFQYGFLAKTEVVSFDGEPLRVDPTQISDKLSSEFSDSELTCNIYMLLYYLRPDYRSHSFRRIVMNYDRFKYCLRPELCYVEQPEPFYERMLAAILLAKENDMTSEELDSKYSFCKEILLKINTESYPSLEAHFYRYFAEEFFKQKRVEELSKLSTEYYNKITKVDYDTLTDRIRLEPILLSKQAKEYKIFGRYFPDFIINRKWAYYYNIHLIKPTRIVLYDFCNGGVLYKMDKTGFSGLLNNISWYNYKLIENTATLQTILKWIELSKRLEEGYYNLDTYAHILYGLGKRSEAIEAQTRAIKLAEKEKQRTSLEKMNLDLEKMKKGSVLTN